MDKGAITPGTVAPAQPEHPNPTGSGKRRSFSRIWLALALLVLSGLIPWLWWERAHRAPPQIITLPNGERYQFAGVTYGTNNVPPYFPARLVHWLPKRLADPMRKFLGNRITQVNLGQKIDTLRLFVWFRHLESNGPVVGPVLPPLLRTRLVDESGLEAGVTGHLSFSTNVTWSYADFQVFPRRGRTLQLKLYPMNTPGGSSAPIGSVTMPNPFYRQFPQWQPEPMSAVKQAGDMAVRLEDLAVGRSAGGAAANQLNAGRRPLTVPAKPGEESITGFYYSVSSNGEPDPDWVLHRAVLSDATGNVIVSVLPHPIKTPASARGRPVGSAGPGNSERLMGALWPDESAWRLKLDIKRTAGFAPEEMVTFKSVPVPAAGTTSVLHQINYVGGVQIMLARVVRRPVVSPAPGQPPGGLEGGEAIFDMSGVSEGLAVDFLGMTIDGEKAENFLTSGSDKTLGVLLTSMPTNAQTIDFTLVVQKTRSVEFLVKPPKPD